MAHVLALHAKPCGISWLNAGSAISAVGPIFRACGVVVARCVSTANATGGCGQTTQTQTGDHVATIVDTQNANAALAMKVTWDEREAMEGGGQSVCDDQLHPRSPRTARPGAMPRRSKSRSMPRQNRIHVSRLWLARRSTSAGNRAGSRSGARTAICRMPTTLSTKSREPSRSVSKTKGNVPKGPAFILRNMPVDLWARVKAQARREGRPLRWLLLRLLELYASKGLDALEKES